jgi:hypothetical protein
MTKNEFNQPTLGLTEAFGLRQALPDALRAALSL